MVALDEEVVNVGKSRDADVDEVGWIRGVANVDDLAAVVSVTVEADEHESILVFDVLGEGELVGWRDLIGGDEGGIGQIADVHDVDGGPSSIADVGVSAVVRPDVGGDIIRWVLVPLAYDVDVQRWNEVVCNHLGLMAKGKGDCQSCGRSYGAASVHGPRITCRTASNRRRCIVTTRCLQTAVSCRQVGSI